MEAYQAALEQSGVTLASEIGSSRTKAGTLNAAIVAYYKSPGFADPVLGLAITTQGMRRAILERWRAEDAKRHRDPTTASHREHAWVYEAARAKKLARPFAA